MIIVDVNLLIYAYNAGARQHAASRRWLESAFSGPEAVRIPWAVVHAFLRLTMSGPFMTLPFTTNEATAIVESWFAGPMVAPIDSGPGYWRVLREVLISANVRGSLVSDAHIAALAIEHDATLYTADGDFRRFRGLRFVNPLT